MLTSKQELQIDSVVIKKIREFSQKFTKEDVEVFRLYLIIQTLVSNKISSEKFRGYLLENDLARLLNVNSVLLYDFYNNTVLHHIITSENIKLCNFLLDVMGDLINPNQGDIQGKNILILAAKMRNTGLVKTILKCSFAEKLNVDATDKQGRTALHYACALGDLTMVEMLLESGANPNLKDQKGNIPFLMTFFPPYQLKNILRSVGLDPKRDVAAPLNNFHLEGDEFFLYTKDNLQRYIEKNMQDDNKLKFEMPINVLQRLSGKSIMECSLEGQLLVRQFLRNKLEYTELPEVNDEFNEAKVLLQLDDSNFRQTIEDVCPGGSLVALEELLNDLEDPKSDEGRLVMIRLLNDHRLSQTFFPNESTIPSELDAELFPQLYAFAKEIKESFKNFRSQKVSSLLSEQNSFFSKQLSKPISEKESLLFLDLSAEFS